MPNQLANDKMSTLWGEVAKTTGMKMSVSKSLDKYIMGSASNSDHGADCF